MSKIDKSLDVLEEAQQAILNLLEWDSDFNERIFHKATETQLVRFLNQVRTLRPKLDELVGHVEYELGWRRAEEQKRDHILFKEFNL
jgi:hypothetical protein